MTIIIINTDNNNNNILNHFFEKWYVLPSQQILITFIKRCSFLKNGVYEYHSIVVCLAS